MAKPNNDYLKRLLGQNEINPATGLSDPESANALAGYSDPRSRYRTDFGDLSQGRAYASDMKDAVVHRGDEEEYADTKAYSQGGGGYFSQGSWGFRFNTLSQYLLKAGAYTAQSVGFLAGMGADLVESAGVGAYNAFAKDDMKRPGTMFSRVADNEINKLLSSMPDAVNERFPIFKSTAYSDGNWVSKAMTPEFWASDFVDGLAFAASSFVGGGAVAKGLNAGENAARLLNVGSKAQKAAQAAGTLGLPNVQRFIKGVDFTTSVMANTAMEAMFEAKDVRDAILADSNLSMKMTPEELEQTAAEKARDVFYLNMLFLAPSNMFELGSLMGKGLKGGSRITRQADNLVDMLPDGSYAKLSPKWYEKPIAKLPYTMATNAIGEGLYEENIQYLIQEVSKFNAHQGPGKGFGDTFGKLLSNVGAGELTNNVTDEQAQSILLGSAIGGGMQASHISPKINKLLGGDGGIVQQYRDKLKNRDKLYDDLANASKSASAIDVFERNAPEAYNFTKEEDAETGEVKYYMERGAGESETDTKRELSEKTWKALATNAGIDIDKGGVGEVSLPKLDNEGAPMFSVSKLEEAYKKIQRREELDTIYEALSANPDKNKYSLEVIRAAKIADLALAHFRAGLGAQLSGKIDSLISMEQSNQDLVDVSAVDVMEIESTKAYVKALEEMYNSLEVGIVTDPAELKLQTARKEVLFDRGSRILTLGKLLDQNKKNVSELSRALQTTNSELADQLADEKWSSLKDIFSSFDAETFNYKNALDRNNWKEISEQANNQYNSFYEMLNNLKVSKNNDEFIKLKTEVEKGLELTQSRDTLYQEWKDLSDLYKGGQYYADNYNGVSRKYDYITPSIDLKKTTLQQYLNWEKTQLPILRLRKRIHQANKDFLNKYIKDLLRNGESMVNVLDWAIANEVSLSDHHIKVILDELSDIRDQYKALSEDIKSANDQIDDGYAFGEITPEKEAELNDRITAAIATQAEIKQAVGAFFDYDLGELDALLRDIKNRNTFENASELDMKKYLAKSLVGFVESTLSNFNNNESYDDLTSLDETRETLESLIRILKKRKDSADFESLIAELEAQLADVITAQDVVVDRQLNKFRKEYVRVNALAQGMIDIMPEKDVKELRAQLEANKAELEELEKNKEDRVRKPVGFNIFPILNFASGNKDVLAAAQKLYDDLVNNFIANNDRYAWINSETAKREFPKAAKTNAVKAIKTLLQHYLSEQTAPMKGFERADYGYDKGPDSSLNRYLSDGDIDAMIASLEGSEKRPDHPLSNAQLLEIAKLLKQLESLELTIAIAGSDVPVVSFIKQLDKELSSNEELFKQDKSFTPATSILQALTVFQIYNNLRSALSKEKYGNWTYLKAPAGGGKTSVVVRYALKMLGTPINQVISAGHNEHSAKGIQQSLGTANAYSTQQLTEAIEKKTLPADTQLIVIDEIGGLSQMEVNQIGTLLQTNYPNARVLVMGDPNQVTKSDAGKVAVEQAFGVASTQLDQIWNIREVTPLFSRYRSDNPSVTNLQDSFLFRKDQLTSAVGTANVDSSEITSTDKPLHGTFIDTTSGSLVPIVLNAEAKNPDRSRAILVKNDEAKAAIKAQLDKSLPSNKVEILTYVEAQGRTIDEVYVNIPYDKGIFSDIIDYNKAMYTATSRGKYFVYVGHITSAANKVDSDLLNKAQSVKMQKDNNFAGIRSYLADALSVLGKFGVDVQDAPQEPEKPAGTEPKEKVKNFEEFITGETTDKGKEDEIDERTDDETNDVRDDDENPKPSDPEQKEEVDDIEIDEDTTEHDEDHVTNEVITTSKPISPENTSQNTQSLIESSSNVFKPMTASIDGVVKEVFKGINAFIETDAPLEVQLIRARGKGDSEERFMIVRQEPEAFIVLGILTPEELKNYDTANLQLNSYAATGTNNVIQIPQFKGGKTYQVDLQKSKGLKYQYQSGRSKFDFNSVVKKWAESFFGKIRSIRGEVLDTDYEVQIANEAVLDQARIVVPTKGNKGGNVIVDAGKPYILISGAQSVRKSKGKSIGDVSSAIADQFIMLTPRLLNRNNNKHKAYIEPLQKYIASIKQFHGTLNQWLGKDVDRKKYQLGSFEFSELVTLLANVHAYNTLGDYSLGEKTELTESDQTYGILFTLFPNKEFLQSGHPLLTQAAEIDVAVHGEWADRQTTRKNSKTKAVEVKYRRDNKGQAQQMFDKLARANLWTNIPNDKGGYRPGILRDDRLVPFFKNGQEDSVVKTVGRHLLGPTNARKDEKPKYKYRADVVRNLEQAAKRSELNAQKTGSPVINFGTYDKRIDSTTGRQYFTVEELDFIFGDQAFDNNGQHNGKNGSGLRIPISRFKFNNKTERQLRDEGIDVADYFDDTFVRVEPNRIVVFDPAVAKTVTPEQVKQEAQQAQQAQPPVDTQSEFDDFEAMDKLMDNEILIGFDEDVTIVPPTTEIVPQNLDQERLDYILDVSKKTGKNVPYILENVVRPATSLLTALTIARTKAEFLEFYKDNPIVFDIRESKAIEARLKELKMDYMVPMLSRIESLLYVTQKIRNNPYAYFTHQDSDILTPVFNSKNVLGIYFTSLSTYVSKMNFNGFSSDHLKSITHETVHSIIFEIAKDKKAFNSLYVKLKRLKAFEQPIPSYANKTISEFLSLGAYVNMSEEIRINEALTIFIDAYLRGEIQFTQSILDKIKEWLQQLLAKVGLENLLADLTTVSPQMLAYSIGKALETRTQLNPIKVARENNDQAVPLIEADANPIDTAQLMQLYEQLNPQTLKQVLRRWITRGKARNEAESEAFKVVNGAMLSHVEGKEKDGLLKAGMIYIEENLGTEKAVGILKHEVFHKIFRTFLSETERQAVLADTVKNYPYLDGSTETEIEHFAINLFASYEYKRSLTGSIVRFFDRLLFRIGIFNRQTTELTTFFDRLFNGYYAGKGKYEYDGVLSADKLDKYFNNSLAMYEQAKHMLLQHSKNFYDFDRNRKLYPDRSKVPYTFDESLVQTREYFKHRVEQEKKKIEASKQPLAPYYAVMDMLVQKDDAWKELVRTLFPDTDVDKLFDVTDVDEAVENTQIDFLKDNELIDQQRKVLKNVKQQLSTIEYRNTQGESKYVPFAQSYAILIKLMYGLDTNAPIKDQKLFIASRLIKAGTSPEARALQNYIFRLIDKLYLEDESSKASKITFTGDGRIQVALEEQFVDFKKQANEDQRQFIRRVLLAVRDQEFTIQDFWDAYEVYRNRNTYAQIGSSIRSLRKVNNFLGQREKKGSTYIYKYFANRESGSTASLISVLSSGILNNYNTKRKIVFTRKLWDYFKPISERDLDYAKEGIIQFYEELGFNPRIRLAELIISGDIEGQSIVTMYNDIYHFLKRESGGKSLQHVLANLEKEGTLGLEEFIYDESYNFFRRLVDFVAIADPDFQTSSAMRGDGKKTYPFVNSSYALDTLHYLINGKARGGWSPKFLETAFYKENIFVKGANRIIQLVDHDSLKYKGLESTAKLFKNETPFDWTARNFLYAFVGSLNVKSTSYFQFLDTPSNKPKAQAVEVGLLTVGRAKELLEGIRAQEGLRPQLDPKKNVKNYTPNKSYVASDEAIDQMVQDMLDDLINNGILSLTDLSGVYSKFDKNSRPTDEIRNQALKILQGIDKEVLEDVDKLSEDATQEEKDALQQKIDEASAEALEKIDANNEEILRDYYKPAVELFVYNYYVNSHQLRQVTIGDPAFFKTGQESYDIIKRMSIALAPGKQGVVSDKLGFLPEKITVAVGEDLVRYLPNPELLGDEVKYESTDAAGYVTPEFAARVKASYGYEEGLDVVMKPVHFEQDENGVPRALKFSTIELTDELCNKFPGLDQLRTAMRNSKTDIYTFPSAVKVGSPVNVTKNDDTRYDVPTKINPDSQFTIRGENFRIQLNPSHDPISHTANPSQLTYQGIINQDNLTDISKILQYNAQLIDLGSRKLERELSVKRNATPNAVKTTRAVRRKAMQDWFDMPGFEGLWTLVNNDNIDLNMPILQKSLESLMASMFTSASVGFRFLGSKLVLQAEYGTNIVNREGKAFTEPLKWKDDQSWTEVYVPEAWAKQYGLKPGDSFGAAFDKDNKIVAFRLPSTGLHSALVMQIKDFYPTPEGSNGNVVIAPHQIVFQHGSDYDVDSLFVLMKKTYSEVFKFTENKFDLGRLLKFIDPNAPSIELTKTDIVGMLDGKKFDLLSVVNEYYQKASTKLDRLYLVDPVNWSLEDTEFVDAMNGGYKREGIYSQIIALAEELVKNQIIDTFADMLTKEENQKWMDLPITMDRLKGESREGADQTALDIVAQLRGLTIEKNHGELYEGVDLSNPLDQRQMHYNSYSGAALVGVSANSYKDVAYIHMSTPTTEWQDEAGNVYTEKPTDKNVFASKKEAPRLAERLTVNILGYGWNQMSHTEKRVERSEDGTISLVENTVKLGPNKAGVYSEKTYTIWETFDSLINACIDNVKEQIVYLLNLTSQTANQYFAMLSLGIPLQTVVRFMNQPVLYDLAIQSKLSDANLATLQRDIVKAIAYSRENVTLKKEDVTDYLKKLKEEYVLTDITDEAMTLASQAYWQNDKNIWALSDEQLLMQLNVIDQFKKLSEIGDALFEGSKVLNVLRKFPTNYWEQKDILETMFTKISDFGQAELVTNLNREDATSKGTQKKLAEATNKNQLLASLLEEDLSTKEKIAKGQSNIQSNILAHNDSAVTQRVGSWPFVNSSMLSIPNVQHAFKTLSRLVTLQEKMFFRHSKTMNDFIEGIVANMDMNAYAFRKKWKAIDSIKSEFMQFFLSGMSLQFNNSKPYQIKIDNALAASDSKGKTQYGVKAWQLNLIRDLQELSKQMPENKFLSSLEYVWDNTNKITAIKFTSDKSKSGLESLIYKEGFKRLSSQTVRTWERGKGKETTDEQEFTDIQLRLFHYLIATFGTEFGRTSYSMVIPDRMYEVYSSVFTEYMQRTVKDAGEGMLNKLKDQFLIQFVNNNSNLLPTIKADDSRLRKDMEDPTTRFAFTLKVGDAIPPRFVTHFKDVYTYIGNLGSYALYQKLSYKSAPKYYNFKDSVLETGFDMFKVFSGRLILPKEQGFANGVYTTLNNQKQVARVGEIVQLHSTSDVSYTTDALYTVTDVIDKGEGAYEYKLSYLQQLDYSLGADDQVAPLIEPEEPVTPQNQMEENIRKVMEEVTEMSTDKASNVINTLTNLLSTSGLQLDPERNLYTAINRTYQRLTEWTRTIFRDAYDKDIYTYRAEEDFRKQNIALTDMYTDNSGTSPIAYTLEERIAYHKKTINSAAASGRAVHAFLEYYAEKDPKKKEEIIAKAREISKEKRDEKGNIVQQGLNAFMFKWLDVDTVQRIFTKAGININIKSEQSVRNEDKLMPELMAYSNTLGFATQIDGLVVHSNGDVSIVDWKTGQLFSDEFTNRVFKYATALGASKVNTAKLEVVLRAFALKEMMPEAKFRQLSLGLISRAKGGVHMVDIELKDYLSVIEAYVKAEMPAAYDQLKKDGMFNAKTYLTDSQVAAKFKENTANMSPAQQLDWIDTRLRTLATLYSQEEINNNKAIREEYAKLTKLKLEVDSRLDLSFNDETEDLSKYQRFLFNVKEIPSKFVKAFSKILFARKNNKNKRFDKRVADFHAVLNPVIREFMEKTDLGAISKLTRGNINYIPFLKGMDRKKLFAFMWRKFDQAGYHGYFANTLDTYYDEASGKEVQLTEAQKAFKEYFHTSMNEEYNNVVKKEIVNRNGKKTTIAREQGLPDSLETNFMPRTFKTTSDMFEEVGSGSTYMDIVKQKVQQSLEAFTEDPYQGDNVGIPIRYMNAPDSKVVQENLHSFDVERAWRGFMSDVINKDEMEDVYSLAKGLKTFYSSQTDRKGNPAMPKMTAFIEDVIFAHILNRMPEENMTGKTYDIVIDEKTANSYVGKMLDLKQGQALSFSWEKTAMAMKNWTSMVSMAVKPVQGTLNGMLIFGTNFLRASSNSMSEWWFGVKSSDFTLKEFILAHADVMQMMKDKVVGSESKLFNLARSMQFLTDNYDYKNMSEDLLTAKNSWFSSSILYIFHSMFESYGQYVLLAAMMRKQQVQVGDQVKSMYELYNENGEYTGPVRGVIQDKLGNTTELKELDAMEIQRMKRVSEKLHGSYRKDERVMAELSVVGQVLFQFKKYLPGLIKNNWRGTYEDMYLGKYVLKVDEQGVPIRPDGMDMYEWEEMQVTGRVRLLLGFLTATAQRFISPDSKYRMDQLEWKNLSEQQKQELINVFQTFAFMAVALLFFAGFDDKEKETAWYKRLERLSEDLTLGLDFRDLLRPIGKNPLPSVAKVIELSDAVIGFFTDGLPSYIIKDEADRRGWPEGAYDIFMNVPIGSSIHALDSFVKSIDPDRTILDKLGITQDGDIVTNR